VEVVLGVVEVPDVPDVPDAGGVVDVLVALAPSPLSE
jgi:hypothetical protein